MGFVDQNPCDLVYRHPISQQIHHKDPGCDELNTTLQVRTLPVRYNEHI